MKLPKEMGRSPDLVARRVRYVFGSRDAGKCWKDTYTQAVGHAGFATSTVNPCVFVYHQVKETRKHKHMTAGQSSLEMMACH